MKIVVTCPFFRIDDSVNIARLKRPGFLYRPQLEIFAFLMR